MLSDAHAVESGKSPVIFLMGPTASGKTEAALKLCQQLPVDIISVDSAQVYRGMDIGSAKPDAATLAVAPHRLIDIRDPADSYSAAEFVADARREIQDITRAGRIPLLVGGTMLYFRMLIDGVAALPASDAQVRGEILTLAAEHGWPYVHAQLAKVDPETAAEVHPNHSQRIQRALEVHRLTGITLSQSKRDHQAGRSGTAGLGQDYSVEQFALLPADRAVVHQGIATRFQSMLDEGLLAEVEALHQRGDLHPEMTSIRAVGYRQVWGFLDGDYDHEEMVARSLAATRQLAKRQFTWLRAWPDLREFSVGEGEGRVQWHEALESLMEACAKLGRI